MGGAVAGSEVEVCPRPATGSTVAPPAEVRASNGRLQVAFAFRSGVDDNGLTRYCYVSVNNTEAPTLRVKPGDEVVLDVKNELAPPAGKPPHRHHDSNPCSAGPMTALSTNLHFHGLAIPPTCHQDDVIHTLIQPAGPAFQYRFKIPTDQPPGLYWYHPHPHGYSEGQVLGGASGALIVEGIAETKPEVASLPERLLILRDQLPVKLPNVGSDADDATGKDVSLNFVPVMYPLYMPAVMRVEPDRREFWRVLNASADTYFDLQVITVENGGRVAQSLELIAMDGVATGEGTAVTPRTSILLSPGARAEFIVTTAHAGAFSQLVSRAYDTGPDGTANRQVVIANIISAGKSPNVKPSIPKPDSSFAGLTNMRPARTRKLYFSEDREDLRTPGKPAKYFITVEGKTPALFDHEFQEAGHKCAARNCRGLGYRKPRARSPRLSHPSTPLPIARTRWSQSGGVHVCATPSTCRSGTEKAHSSRAYRLRMDFRAAEIVGTFVFHCHILEHEDAGMMGSIEVVKGR